MPDNILYIFLLATGASFIQRTTGFGFGIFIMTALPFLMPPYGEAVTLSGILSLTSSTDLCCADQCDYARCTRLQRICDRHSWSHISLLLRRIADRSPCRKPRIQAPVEQDFHLHSICIYRCQRIDHSADILMRISLCIGQFFFVFLLIFA